MKNLRLSRLFDSQSRHSIILPIDHGVSLGPLEGITSLKQSLSSLITLSPHYQEKVLIGTVEEALSLGADAVSMHLNLGVENDKEMLKQLRFVSEHCTAWGMPLLTMIYPTETLPNVADSLKKAARIGYELGADLIKICYPGSPLALKEIIESVDIPILISGGSKQNPDEILDMISNAMAVGARGVAIGRNLFQCQNQHQFVVRLNEIIHHKTAVTTVI